MNRSHLFRPFAGLLLAAAQPLSASVAVVSNLEQPGDTSTALRSSDGALLPSGCPAQLVTFPGMTGQEVGDLAAGGWSALMEIADPFGTIATISEGSGESGTIEFQSESPLSESLSGLYLMVSTGDASEVLVLSLPITIPADDLAGPAPVISIHLDQATVVFGQTSDQGFFTVVAPAVQVPGYETWILEQLGEASLEADRAPEADADRDGIANLMEYATGSLPGVGESRTDLRLLPSGSGTYVLQYLRRTDDPSLVYSAEEAETGSVFTWVPLAGSPVTLDSLPAPEFYEWVEQPLSPGTTGFARLKVEQLLEVD
ncbi:hypothetical protein [Luteolibacter marinus]|uniref:hypothetical protein n=1 Tax=Luteolibacter marinus TaxID=2776705 RepID=UPI0018677BA2|nr:hypothetical protein [Luteolibacter marinus]